MFYKLRIYFETVVMAQLLFLFVDLFKIAFKGSYPVITVHSIKVDDGPKRLKRQIWNMILPSCKENGLINVRLFLLYLFK